MKQFNYIDRGKRFEHFYDLWKKATPEGNKKTFSDMAHIIPQNLNRYFAGEYDPMNVSEFILEDLERVGLTLDWLAVGKVKKTDIGKEMMLLEKIPVFAHINAGAKKWVVSDQPYEHIGVPFSTDKSRFGLKVKGNSMSGPPDNINDGDIVVVSEKAHVKNGDLAVVEWDDDERHIRRVRFQKETIILESNNSVDYPPIYTDKKHIHKMLRVVKHIKDY